MSSLEHDSIKSANFAAIAMLYKLVEASEEEDKYVEKGFKALRILSLNARAYFFEEDEE